MQYASPPPIRSGVPDYAGALLFFLCVRACVHPRTCVPAYAYTRARACAHACGCACVREGGKLVESCLSFF